MDIDGNPWFVAKDVVDVLELTNTTASILNLNKVDVQTCRIPGTRGRGNKLISESGLYKIIMRSDKPQAKPFQDWVTRVALPAIRKDGGYTSNNLTTPKI